MSEIIDIKNLDVARLNLNIPTATKPEPAIETFTDGNTVSQELEFDLPLVLVDETPVADVATIKKPISDKVYIGTKWIFGAVCLVFVLIFSAQFVFNLPHPKYWQFAMMGPTRGTTEAVFIPVPVQAQQVKLIETGRFLVALQYPDGKIIKAAGGSLSWRLHNPGRLAYNKFTAGFGAFGVNEGYAIFPSYEQGLKALTTMLFDDPRHGYRTLSIKDAIKKFNENDSDSAEYARLVGKALKIPVSTKLDELNDVQKEAFIGQIKIIEQFVPGRVWEYKDIAEFKRLG